MITNGPSRIAAQYLRVSTEHQQYSLENQSETIRAYAERVGFEVVHTYRDAGKSGLVLNRRDGLRQLLNDVVSGNAKYSAILVYDISRWGRFQDVDEAAHYEFLCKSAGMEIHYCAEQFANDNSLSSSMMKALKRVMAGEYSRELSVKVHEGEKRLARAGFRTGGTPGYGFRRQLVSANRQVKCVLSGSERKSLQSDRVILVPGPENEVRCVRDIFRMFTETKMSPSEIAADLTRRGIPYTGGKRNSWYGQAVSRILRHPKYCGCSVFGQSTCRLRMRKIRNPRETWTITSGAWLPLVDQATFDRAQKRFSDFREQRTDAELLSGLRQLLHEHGKLSEDLINRSTGVPSGGTYARRFGTLSEAFEKAGYSKARVGHTRTKRSVRILRDEILAQIVATNPSRISIFQPDGNFRLRLRVSRTVVSVFVCRCLERKGQAPRWVLGPILRERNLMALIVLLKPGNTSVKDLFILPDMPPQTRHSIKTDDPWLRLGHHLDRVEDFLSVVNLVRPCRGSSQ